MDKETINKPATEPNNSQCGIFARGIVVSSTADAFERKDGSGVTVRVAHELALRPGMALFEQWLDPKTDARVSVQNLEVKKFPQLAEFKTVTLHAERYRVDDSKRLIITKATVLDSKV
ncbi:MAG: hypothetical protein AAF591_18515 [Verrucomicrobiota bacterium]